VASQGRDARAGARPQVMEAQPTEGIAIPPFCAKTEFAYFALVCAVLSEGVNGSVGAFYLRYCGWGPAPIVVPQRDILLPGCRPSPACAEEETGSSVPIAALPAEGGRRRRPPAGRP
jgi:hypothetical protein